MWNRAGVCVFLLVAASSARPSKEGRSSLDDGLQGNGMYMYGEHFEGDIRLPFGESHSGIGALGALIPTLLWDKGIVYYTIKKEDFKPEEISEIEKGIAELVESTKVNGANCIQIIPRTTEKDYIEVFNGVGCWSNLGRSGRGKQQLSLNTELGCLHRITVLHEFLHALAFVHEHTRPDRDDYVTINEDNIQPAYKSDFKKRSPDEVNLLGTSYDYYSVMHYSAYNSAAINESIPTIIPHDPKLIDVIGRVNNLSPTDIKRVHILYNCTRPADTRFSKIYTKN